MVLRHGWRGLRLKGFCLSHEALIERPNRGLEVPKGRRLKTRLLGVTNFQAHSKMSQSYLFAV